VDGLAETIKYGVFRDKELFALYRGKIDRIKALDKKSLRPLFTGPAKIKPRWWQR